MKTIPLISFSVIISLQTFAQQDCSHPVNVIICPSVCFTNQSNEGLGDDAPSSCNIAGEDITYCVHVTNGATALFVSIENASAPMLLIVEHDACLNSGCISMNVPAGDTNVTFHDTAVNYYNVWVDAPVGVTFDICFGADTGSTYVSVPNTQGNLRLDSSICGIPFSNNKRFLQVTYNSVPQTNPLTLPLFTPGTLCLTTYFRNLTGIEGVKQFQFTFHSGGFSSVVAASSSFPGFYNAGTWVCTSSGFIFTFNFIDAAGLGKGDFLPPPDSCLAYTFCFTVTPISNLPDSTNILVHIVSDGFGAPYTGWINQGCCPTGFLNCTGMAAVSGGSTHSFGFGIDDPANALPVTLASFDASVQKQHVQLRWTTSSEINNDYFTIERSQAGAGWTSIARIEGAGNSALQHFYRYTDEPAAEGTLYYRLKQTDYDGHFSYSQVRYVLLKESIEVSVFPNPSTGIVTILSSVENAELKICNAMGTVVFQQTMTGTQQAVNLSAQPKGIYFLELAAEGQRKVKKVVVE